MSNKDHQQSIRSNKYYKSTLFDIEPNSIGLLELSDTEITFDNYNLEKYIDNVNSIGLEKTWAHILLHVTKQGCNDFLSPINFGYLYEAGLAEQDKNNKKKSGQYYTPSDVSKLMATWLFELEGQNICDVGCGTGNLILSYLSLLKPNKVKQLLDERRIYLYDFDKIAITIAQYSIALTYGINHLNNINIVYGDFLCKDVKLPQNSKVISNPPYAKFDNVSIDWNNSKIQIQTKEFYASFMEKIIESKSRAVIITPYSFLGGSKFQELRNFISDYSGFIVAFDNVPGNIFNGRKHGIFNTNTANSVRAAITVVQNIDNIRGFRTTPLIRFKNEERKLLLDSNLLKKQLSRKYQNTNNGIGMFARCHIELEDCFDIWLNKSTSKAKDFVSFSEQKYTLYMPNTCRYYTTASKKKLNRGGYLTISLEDRNKYNYTYCLINSSFAYWWWRVYDGGITYPVGLFNSIPIFYGLLSDDDKNFFDQITNEMILNEDKYTVTKMNAGNIQENIKFPKKYRDMINDRFLKILSCDADASKFDLLHMNSFFGTVSENEDE
ncbi:MAG: N-6 DNA methylase [Acholeplasma sp.]|nr:N-6 DNA methylase [Acholeplasma sp.]